MSESVVQRTEKKTPSHVKHKEVPRVLGARGGGAGVPGPESVPFPIRSGPGHELKCEFYPENPHGIILFFQFGKWNFSECPHLSESEIDLTPKSIEFVVLF